MASLDNGDKYVILFTLEMRGVVRRGGESAREAKKLLMALAVAAAVGACDGIVAEVAQKNGRRMSRNTHGSSEKEIRRPEMREK